MRGGRTDQPLWINARVIFDFRSPGSRSTRRIVLRRPHGLIGSVVGADVTIPDTSISARHAYLHVDDRGVCIVDLASRTGTRLNGRRIDSAWLRIGDVVEIAGRELELREIHLNGFPFAPPLCLDHPLNDVDERVRVGVALEPLDARGTSWVVGSELLFIGQGESCGIRLPVGAAKTHCALVRSISKVHVIDLLVDRTSVNNQPVRGAARLQDGDILTVGRAEFLIHIESFSGEMPPIPAGWAFGSLEPHTLDEPNRALLRAVASIPTPDDGSPPPLDSVPAESQPPVVAWMLQALQASHGELLRRQNELQDALARVITQAHDDFSSSIETQTERVESLGREVDELRRLVEAAPPREPSITAPPPLQAPAPQSSTDVTPHAGEPTRDPVDSPRIGTAEPAERPRDRPSLDPVPNASPSPLAQPRTPPPAAPERPLVPALIAPAPTHSEPAPTHDFVGPPAPVSDRSRETTSWLLQRIDKIESESRFSLRSLLPFGRKPAPRPLDDDFDAELDDPDDSTISPSDERFDREA
jgi:pSer/pThr/pTyr-binding forkhead associated (FHA) protein